MKRLALAGSVGLLLAAALVFSQNQPTPAPAPMAAPEALQIESGTRNPWTHLRLNNNSDDFRFVIVSDRTGGHREKIFSRAVEQINLLQPEFVLSVGDLIEGYSTDAEETARQWREFQSFVSRLQMPFFYVPGNHDLANPAMESTWQEKFGKRYYHFVYKNVLFLILCSENPPGSGSISAEQIAYAKKVLEENANVRWTIVALHRPIWIQADDGKNGWLEVEKALSGRRYTVFAGHLHRYQKYQRQGMNYYQLATTGGVSRLRGTRYGEFDHIVQVTMKPSGPLLANIMLDGIYPEDMKMPETNEPVIRMNRKPCFPVRGTVHLDGVPASGALVAFHLEDPVTKKLSRLGDALIDSDGSFELSTYISGDGAPEGEYVVTVQTGSYGQPPHLPGGVELPPAYTRPGTSPLRATVKRSRNEFAFDLRTEMKQ